MQADVERLLQADEPWVAYAALVDLLGEEHDSPAASAAYARLRRDPCITNLMDSLEDWPAGPLAAA